jgi:hypothetical protein
MGDIPCRRLLCTLLISALSRVLRPSRYSLCRASPLSSSSAPFLLALPSARCAQSWARTRHSRMNELTTAPMGYRATSSIHPPMDFGQPHSGAPPISPQHHQHHNLFLHPHSHTPHTYIDPQSWSTLVESSGEALHDINPSEGTSLQGNYWFTASDARIDQTNGMEFSSSPVMSNIGLELHETPSMHHTHLPRGVSPLQSADAPSTPINTNSPLHTRHTPTLPIAIPIPLQRGMRQMSQQPQIFWPSTPDSAPAPMHFPANPHNAQIWSSPWPVEAGAYVPHPAGVMTHSLQSHRSLPNFRSPMTPSTPRQRVQSVAGIPPLSSFSLPGSKQYRWISSPSSRGVGSASVRSGEVHSPLARERDRDGDEDARKKRKRASEDEKDQGKSTLFTISG